MARKAKHEMATAGKAQNPDHKCYRRDKIVQLMKMAQSNSFKAMEYLDFSVTEARRRDHENKIAYNNQRVANSENGARKVSMDQA